MKPTCNAFIWSLPSRITGFQVIYWSERHRLGKTKPETGPEKKGRITTYKKKMTERPNSFETENCQTNDVIVMSSWICCKGVWTPGGGGGNSKKFYTRRLRPEVQPLTLLYTIFFKKGTPFVYLVLEKSTPFIYLLMNKSLKQEVLLSFFFT